MKPTYLSHDYVSLTKNLERAEELAAELVQQVEQLPVPKEMQAHLLHTLTGALDMMRLEIEGWQRLACSAASASLDLVQSVEQAINPPPSLSVYIGLVSVSIVARATDTLTERKFPLDDLLTLRNSWPFLKDRPVTETTTND